MITTTAIATPDRAVIQLVKAWLAAWSSFPESDTRKHGVDNAITDVMRQVDSGAFTIADVLRQFAAQSAAWLADLDEMVIGTDCVDADGRPVRDGCFCLAVDRIHALEDASE